MSDDVERVARAVCLHYGRNPDEYLRSDELECAEYDGQLAWKQYVGVARAALTASRSYSDEIEEAARQFTRSVYDHLGKGRLGGQTAWDEMHSRFKDQLYPLVLAALSKVKDQV